MLSRLALLALVAFLALGAQQTVRSQDVEEQPDQAQQQQVTLTREKLDQLLQLMTPNCRTELESALASQGQISMDCRAEIQTAFQTLGVDLQQSAHAEGEQEEYSEPPRQRRSAQEAPAPEAPQDTTTTILAIVGFIVALFAGAGGFIMFKQSQIDPDSTKKPKKLSKKKEEKEKLRIQKIR